MAGASLYFLLSSVVYLVGTSASDLSADSGLLWAGLFVVLFIAIGLRNGGAILVAGRDGPQPWVYEEWREKRRWRWVFAVGILVTGALVGVVALLRGWEAVRFPLSAETFVFGTLMFGLLLRMLLRREIESHAEPT